MKNGKTITVQGGDILYMPKGTEYTLNVTNRVHEGSCTFGINFSLLNDNLEAFTASEEPILFKVSNPQNYYSLFSQMSKISDASISSSAKLKAYFYEIIASLCEACQFKELTSKDFKIIEKGIKYLENDYKLDLSVSDIAALCMVSENYFRRLFKEYSGISPKEYILNAKIDKAKLRLREGNIPISEIAETCGFPDAAYFCRIFKKRTGLSPLAYRNSKK